MSRKIVLTEETNISKISYSCNQTHKIPRAIILICQSIEENPEDYNAFCEYLSEENIAYYIYSYRNTINKDPNISYGHLGERRDSTILQDVMKLRTLISDNHGNAPVLLFGYSLGTIIALSTLINYPQKFSGIALWNLDMFFEKYSCILMTLFLKMEKFFKRIRYPKQINAQFNKQSVE
ncbi:serine aminopeptidase domain-containing protein [Candidatus Liberibacter africanus]|uniref:serine aminopeptidase domain-containing protein n=1 Tax=Liberibacter africanus TaxID=34020 RepID=UPI000AA5FCC5|nr:alpha/beta hydrolase [Candidatus Liberibacter africanus]